MAYFSQLDQAGRAKALESNRADASNGVLFSRPAGMKVPLRLVQQRIKKLQPGRLLLV